MQMSNIIAQRLHEIVQTGTLGLDYTFDVEREKNKALRRNYVVNDALVKDILLRLTDSHYIKSEQSNNSEHPEDTVHIFKIIVALMPRYEEEATYKDVCIYIKVTWPDGEEPMFVISFHEDEEKNRVYREVDE